MNRTATQIAANPTPRVGDTVTVGNGHTPRLVLAIKAGVAQLQADNRTATRSTAPTEKLHIVWPAVTADEWAALEYCYERRTCTRCGGTGTYSYNQIDGNRCYGCAGGGQQYTPAGARAKAAFDTAMEALDRPVVDLVPGDRYLGRRSNGSKVWRTARRIEHRRDAYCSSRIGVEGKPGYEALDGYQVAVVADVRIRGQRDLLQETTIMKSYGTVRIYNRALHLEALNTAVATGGAYWAPKPPAEQYPIGQPA